MGRVTVTAVQHIHIMKKFHIGVEWKYTTMPHDLAWPVDAGKDVKPQGH